MKMWAVYRHLLLFGLVLGTYVESIMICPIGCDCYEWTKVVICHQFAVKEIPKTLSSDLHELNLSQNKLKKVPSHVFKDLGLVNLTSLSLWSCKIDTIEKNGLSGLPSLTKLNLFSNSLKALDADTFKEIVKIEWINLSHNQIETLGDEIFNNLLYLKHVNLAYNKIFQISAKTFLNVPKLTVLELEGNELDHLKIESLSALTSLASLTLKNNPWRCDCHLGPFRDWVVDKMVLNDEDDLECAGPENKNGEKWKELASSEFACVPRITYVSSTRNMRTPDVNITIACQADGDPLPEVNWVLNGAVINGTKDYYGESKYYITQNCNESSKWVNLTIVGVHSADSGNYVCVAKNAAGIVQRSLTIEVPAAKRSSWILVIVLVIAAIAVGAITYWLHRRHKVTKVAAKQEILDQPSVGDYSRIMQVHT